MIKREAAGRRRGAFRTLHKIGSPGQPIINQFQNDQTSPVSAPASRPPKKTVRVHRHVSVPVSGSLNTKPERWARGSFSFGRVSPFRMSTMPAAGKVLEWAAENSLLAWQIFRNKMTFSWWPNATKRHAAKRDLPIIVLLTAFRQTTTALHQSRPAAISRCKSAGGKANNRISFIKSDDLINQKSRSEADRRHGVVRCLICCCRFGSLRWPFAYVPPSRPPSRRPSAVRLSIKLAICRAEKITRRGLKLPRAHQSNAGPYIRMGGRLASKFELQPAKFGSCEMPVRMEQI
jgi:hypothetical protein